MRQLRTVGPAGTAVRWVVLDIDAESSTIDEPASTVGLTSPE